MSWTQYEVWAEMDGHQELIETTHSLKEATLLADKTFEDGCDLVQVYEETDDGEYKIVRELSR